MSEINVLVITGAIDKAIINSRVCMINRPLNTRLRGWLVHNKLFLSDIRYINIIGGVEIDNSFIAN